jgi:hypothetical protein
MAETPPSLQSQELEDQGYGFGRRALVLTAWHPDVPVSNPPRGWHTCSHLHSKGNNSQALPTPTAPLTQTENSISHKMP